VVAFSHQGSKFAIGSNNTLRLYKAARLGERESPELIAPLLGEEGSITSLTFSPDGERLAANDAGKVRLWDTRDPRDSVALESGAGSIKTPFISPDSQSVLMLARYAKEGQSSTKEETQVRMWDAASQQELKLPAEFAQPHRVVANSPGGRFLAILSSASTIKLWDTQPLKLTATFNVNPPAKGEKTVKAIAVSPDGRNVAAQNLIETRENDHSVHSEWDLELWNEDLPDQPFVLKGPTDSGGLSGVEFSPDGKTLACFGDAVTTGIELWDIASKKVAPLVNSQIVSVDSLVFSPDSAKLVVIGSSGDRGLTAEVWDAHSRQLIMTLGDASGSNDPDTQGAPRHFKSLFEGSRLLGTFSLDGRLLAIGGHSKLGPSVELWNMEHAEPRGPLARLSGFKNPISCMAFSADSKVLATGDLGGQVTLWSTASHRRLITLYSEALKDPFDSIAFSPDNRILITSTKGGSVRLWPTLPAGQ
jgi:WD40 repeat protein